MPVEKILAKIRENIRDTAALLDGFSEEAVQPGVEECTHIQRQLHDLLELIAVYKHNKVNYEISPSFNLHARISETTAEISSDQVPAPPVEKVPDKKQDAPDEKRKESPARNGSAARPLQIGLNDKFRFINELFAHNDAEYHIAVEQLGNLGTWSETDLYLNSLKNLYGWRDNHDAVKYFYSIVKKRFQ